MNRNIPLQVFLITDGEVANTEDVVALCKRYHGSTGARMFTFGIGGEVSQSLVKGAATAGTCSHARRGHRGRGLL